MHITNDNRLKKLIVIGDRLLIKLTKPDERTASGLYLPPGVQEKPACLQAGKKCIFDAGKRRRTVIN